ncbi:MAG: type 1 glutamine amidotransferase [Burkholderiales bacterium]
MTQPLLVGVSARIYHPAGPMLELGGVFTKTLHYLEQSVAHWVLSSNALVVMIPAAESEGLLTRSELRLADYADRLDALVLQGGNDIAPQSYGETPLHPDWTGDPVRDRYETALFHAFVAAGKPVLGICRGCQLINVALGGTLYQDIATQISTVQAHRDLGKDIDQYHLARLLPGTQLASLYPGVEEAAINSLHHQAVKQLGSDLEVEARAVPDDVVEAIRWRGPSYVFGMQWHPEFMALHPGPAQQLDGGPILGEFLAAAERRRSEAGS